MTQTRAKLLRHKNVEDVAYDEPDRVIVSLIPSLAFWQDPDCGVRGFESDSEALESVRQAIPRKHW